MKRFLAILMLLTLMLFCFGCKTKPTDNKAASVKKQDDTVYPFADISADSIKEAVFGLRAGSVEYACTESYTDANAVAKIVEFLNKAPMTKDGIDTEQQGSNVGSYPDYGIELYGNDGQKYKLSFDGRFKDLGYYCTLYNDVDENSYGDESGKSFYIDGDYLYDLILHIATLDGREPLWKYTSVFSDLFDKESCASAVLEYDGNVKQIDGASADTYAMRMSLVAYADVTDDEWKETENTKKFSASFYDADKKLIFKIELDGYFENKQEYQLLYYGAKDSAAEKIVTSDYYFAHVLKDAENGFNSWY